MDLLESLKILANKVSDELNQSDDSKDTSSREVLYDEIESLATQVDSLSDRISSIDNSITGISDIAESVVNIEKANRKNFENIKLRLEFVELEIYNSKYKDSIRSKISQSVGRFLDNDGIIPLMCCLTGIAGAGICWVVLTYFI